MKNQKLTKIIFGILILLLIIGSGILLINGKRILYLCIKIKGWDWDFISIIPFLLLLILIVMGIMIALIKKSIKK